MWKLHAPCLFAVALWSALPAPARAWTDTTVEHVDARIEIDRSARARVSLDVQLRVQHGWLEAFELDGLDPDLEIDPTSGPWMRDEAGLLLEPRIEVRSGGRIVYSFRRRHAPGRGSLRAGATYSTSLAGTATHAGDGMLRLAWTLPGWRSGIETPEIVIVAPAGSVPFIAEEDAATVSVTREERDGMTWLTHRRVHLPRTREWTLYVDVPQDALDPAVAPIEQVAPPLRSRVGQEDTAPSGPLPIASLLLGLLAWSSIAARARDLARRRLDARPLLPLAAAWRGALALGAAGAAALLADTEPLVALAALGTAALATLERARPLLRAPRLGSFRRPSRELASRARRALWLERVGLGAWLDLSRAPGAALAISIVALAIVQLHAGAPAELAVVAALALAVLGAPRRADARDPLAVLASLCALARRWRARLDDPPFALSPVVHVDVRGEPQDARMRVVWPETPRGLLRADITACSDGSLVLLLVAREGTPTDRALELALPGAELTRAPRRVVRRVPLDGGLAATIAPITRALAECPTELAAPRAPLSSDATIHELAPSGRAATA